MNDDGFRAAVAAALHASSGTRPGHNGGVERDALSVTGPPVRHSPRGEYHVAAKYAKRADPLPVTLNSTRYPTSSTRQVSDVEPTPFEQAAFEEALADPAVFDAFARLLGDGDT
ncbi:hypothetical protein BJG93_02180 [Paraburkholderia sprentiae WSM5005]|uniref:Uncharacterized protein n=1 Tax=Paraburkholderia sprentiae WSM5005 TaxID=754502 RepID=A0A1I9YDE9_9BURK|nr:hypothetical protein [Paraburkholderia sprentiae]APA84332.1 hypothetical protein BJG93_02180 [Paraburkholderia sprentiae WSM5005]